MKYRWCFLCVLLFALGCSGGGDGSSPSSGVSANPIAGQWYYEGPPTSGGQEGDTIIIPLLMSFNNDSTLDVYLLEGRDSTAYISKCSTTYSVSDNQLHTQENRCDEGESHSYIRESTYTFSVQNNTLTMTYEGQSIPLTRWTGDVAQLHPKAASAVEVQKGLAQQPVVDILGFTVYVIETDSQ